MCRYVVLEGVQSHFCGHQVDCLVGKSGSKNMEGFTGGGVGAMRVGDAVDRVRGVTRVFVCVCVHARNLKIKCKRTHNYPVTESKCMTLTDCVTS